MTSGPAGACDKVAPPADFAEQLRPGMNLASRDDFLAVFRWLPRRTIPG